MKQFVFIISLSVIPVACLALTPEYAQNTSCEIRTFLNACSQGDIPTIRMLFQNNPQGIHALLSAHDVQRRTGLMFLAQYGSSEGVQLLLKHCRHGQKTLKDNKRYTARTYAESEWNPDVAQLLPEDN